MLSPITYSTDITPEKGIVVVRIVNASAYPVAFNQFTINPENLNESKEIKPERLKSLTSKFNGTSVFASEVKPGNYTLSSIRAFHVAGEYIYSRFVSANEKFGTFTVKPGKVTDLGTIIYYQNPQEDQYQNLLVRAPSSDFGEVLRKHFAFYPVNSANILTWNDDGFDEDRHAIFAGIVQNPTIYNQSFRAPDGSIYFLCKLGVILKYTIGGTWELDAVDTNLELTAIDQNVNGDLVVASAEGLLFSKKFGGEWEKFELGYKKHIDVVKYYDQSTIDIVARKRYSLEIIRININNQEIQTKKLNGYRSPQGWETSAKAPNEQAIPRKIISSQVIRFSNRNYLTVTTQSDMYNPINGPKKNQIFQFESKNWEMNAPITKLKVDSLYNAGIVIFGTKAPGFWSLTNQTKYYKYVTSSDRWDSVKASVIDCTLDLNSGYAGIDSSYAGADSKCGPNLEESRRSFTFMSTPVFKNETEAIAIGRFRKYDLMTGKNSYTSQLLITIDSGKSWTETGSPLPSDYCNSLVPYLTDKLLLSCSGASSDFYLSTDNGVSWKHIRQQENI